MNETYSGIIERYSGNGRKFGYPTANFKINSTVEDGVYISFSTLKFNELKYEQLPSLTFIGIPTTVGDTSRRIEVHIFDIPDTDYYGGSIETTLVHKIRNNETLDTVEDLLELMKSDERIAREYFMHEKGE